MDISIATAQAGTGYVPDGYLYGMDSSFQAATNIFHITVS
jgi:hypothetical protein